MVRVVTPTLVYMAAASISDLGYAAHRGSAATKNLGWKEGCCAITTVIPRQPMQSMVPGSGVIELISFIWH
jgi:hypothetical protein